MKLVSFLRSGEASYGLLGPPGPHPVMPDFKAAHADLVSVIAAGATDALAANCSPDPIDARHIRWLPPIPDPAKIMCVGMNFQKIYPVAGMTPPPPGNIVVFSRHTDSLVAHGAGLQIPFGSAADSFDFEGEVVAVIGKPCRNVPAGQAMDHIFGYSIMNEGTVRAQMKQSIYAGKNHAASGSWGPNITTADEFGRFEDISLETRLNGAVMQSCHMREMIFSLPDIISYLSHIAPLRPGDIIATGSPDGAGASRTPPRFLKQGDIVDVSVGGIGTLSNNVAGPETA